MRHGKNQNKISIQLCGKTHTISTHFSTTDMKKYMDSLDSESPKEALINVLIGKFEANNDIPTSEELQQENDDAYEPYVLAVVESTEIFRKNYEQTDVSLSAVDRFALCSKQYWHETILRMAEAIAPAFKLVGQIGKSLDVSLLTSAVQYFNQYRSTVTVAVEQITQTLCRTAEILAPIQKLAMQASRSFSKIIDSLKETTFSDEEKKQLEESHKTWGNMGWSMIPHAEVTLFDQCPADIKEADRVALSYFDKAGIKYLFNNLRNQAIRKEDLESAIFCFENKQYKACALMLFGIIDAKLIRLQPKQNGKNRAVGSGAVKAFERKYKESQDENQFLYQTLYALGTFECLKTFFAYGDDFKKEPLVVNRNFVDHGMNVRSVRRKDCIKLFLVLYNLVEILEFAM